MSTGNQPPGAPATYHAIAGGSLVMPAQPDVLTYPLRQDQFQTLCDGEMSASRSTRDACVGAFLTGVVGIAGVLLTIDWDVAAKQGRHPLFWTLLLCTLTSVALIYGAVESIRGWLVKTDSSYSRLRDLLEHYFGLKSPQAILHDSVPQQ